VATHYMFNPGVGEGVSKSVP